MIWIALIVGGALGTLSRYLLSIFLLNRYGGIKFPFSTFAVNLIGCFLMGFFVLLHEEKRLFAPWMSVFLMSGFCGAFTTFSAFAFDTSALLRDGDSFGALVNVVASVVLGFLLFRTGIQCARMI